MREYRIGRLNGRFVVTWSENGSRRRFRLDALTRKGAEAEAIDVIRARTIRRETAVVSDLWQSYRDHLNGRPTETTMGYTGKPVLAHFGSLRPDQITIEHCRSYAAKRRSEGRKNGAVWTELGHLSSCLKWAAKVRLIDRAPYIERPSKPSPKDRYLSRAEIDRLIAADCEHHIKIAILLMLTTAARVGAVLDLTWDRVDMERGQINLRVDSDGPRKGRAVVPINATLRAALTHAAQAGISDYVIEWNGKQVRSIRNGFSKAVRNAGLSDVTPHVLRHTAAVHMAEGGIAMSKISQFLGHSNTGITERVYARFSPDHMTDAAEILDFGTIRKVR